MNAKESVEMLMDARRSQIRVTHRHLVDMQEYLILRGVPYSPEYLLTWGLFPKSRGARHAYWDCVRALYDELQRDGENALTRYLGLKEPEACITYGYTIPATLGGGYLSDAKREWLVGKMRMHPLLMREWVFAASAAIHGGCSIGDCIVNLTNPVENVRASTIPNL